MASISQSLVQRVKEEVQLMRVDLGAAAIEVGEVIVADKQYVGVIVSGLRVNAQRFSGIKEVKALLLLPLDYPRVPPLGVYLNRPHKLQSVTQHGVGGRHFTGKGLHGAESIQVRGWYWYCHALGAWHAGATQQHWLPKARSADGHNLATVLTAARVSLHEDR
jgi:hypothetical protein